MKTKYIEEAADIICPYCQHAVLIHEACSPPDPCQHVIFIATNEAGFEDIETPYPERFNNRVKGEIDDLTNCADIEGTRIVQEDFSGIKAYFGFEKPKSIPN